MINRAALEEMMRQVVEGGQAGATFTIDGGMVIPLSGDGGEVVTAPEKPAHERVNWIEDCKESWQHYDDQKAALEALGIGGVELTGAPDKPNDAPWEYVMDLAIHARHAPRSIHLHCTALSPRGIYYGWVWDVTGEDVRDWPLDLDKVRAIVPHLNVAGKTHLRSELLGHRKRAKDVVKAAQETVNEGQEFMGAVASLARELVPEEVLPPLEDEVVVD